MTKLLLIFFHFYAKIVKFGPISTHIYIILGGMGERKILGLASNALMPPVAPPLYRQSIVKNLGSLVPKE